MTIAYYTPNGDELHELREALGISNYLKRRTRVRALAYEVLRRCVDADWVAETFKASPLVGKGEGQIKPSNSVKGLRDSLSMVALVNIAAYGTSSIQDMDHALRKPKAQGVKATKSKTGYAFGQHKGMSPEDSVLAGLEAGPEKETKVKDVEQPGLVLDSISEMGLDVLLDGVAMAAGQCKVSPLVVTKALVDQTVGAHKVRAEALHQYIEGLGETEKTELMGRTLTTQGKWFGENLAALMLDAAPEADAEVEMPKAKRPDAEAKKLIDMALKAADMPSVDEMLDGWDEAVAENLRLQREVEAGRKAASAVRFSVGDGPKVEASGDVPEGEVSLMPASEVFGIKKGKDMFRFEVPVWTWKGEHPHVPVRDEDYIFRPYELMCVLIALVKNKPTYLHGHTGTGKTTLIEQVCAWLGWPTFRINFDSEITRLDLLGRDVLITEAGVTVSKFSEGVIPRYMQQGYVMIFDEFDFIRADVSYVMQRVLEKDKLVLTEDGGRVVHPHPFMRLFATGNTVGQGDEYGLYQGARVQSLALLNRFTNWKQIDYLDHDERLKLIAKAGPGLEPGAVNMIAQYVHEHMEAFLENKDVMQPISPRDYTALADQMQTYLAYFPSHLESKAIEEAFNTVILDRASQQDRLVLAGIVDRVKG